MKKILAIGMVLLILTVGFVNIAAASTYSYEQSLVNKQQEQYRIAQPLPYFDWSLERHLAIQLYQSRNERVNTYTVWRSQTGKIEGDCASIGYPLPYDVQLTNPWQAVYPDSSEGSPVIGQPEPNGLYASTVNSISTWVRCVYSINGKTVEAPIYIESIVTTYPVPVTVDYEKNRVTPVQNVMPSVVVNSNRPETVPTAAQ